jgi:hypothetical protein
MNYERESFLTTVRVVDVGSRQVWSVRGLGRGLTCRWRLADFAWQTASLIFTGNVLVLVAPHALEAIVVRDHCRQHASLVGSVCLCDPGWHDSPSVLDNSSLVWNTSSPRPYACVACTPGKFKPTAQGLCEPCQPGTSSGEASTTCQQEGQQPAQPQEGQQPAQPPPTPSSPTISSPVIEPYFGETSKPPTISTPNIELGTTSSTVNITGDFFVIFIVTMPYSRSEFDAGTQQKYKAAIASVAATSADNVEIINITESRRRAGSVDVYTKILLADAVKARQMLERLGEGEGLLQLINVGLKKQDLQESSAVSAPRAPGLGQTQVCIYIYIYISTSSTSSTY